MQLFAAAGQKGEARPSIKRLPQPSTPPPFRNQQHLTRYRKFEATAELLQEPKVVAKLLVLLYARTHFQLAQGPRNWETHKVLLKQRHS